MEKSLLIPIVLQALFTLFLLFRGGLPRWLRFLLLLYLGGLVWFWYPEIYGGAQSLLAGVWLPVLKETLTTAAVSLIWLWPFILLVIIYLSNDFDAKLILLLLLGFTFLVWVGNWLTRMDW